MIDRLGKPDSALGSATPRQVTLSQNNMFSQEVHYKNDNQDHKISGLSVDIKDVGHKRNQLEHKNSI